MNKWARPFDWNGASAAPDGSPVTPATKQYFAFLSYSHRDSADADWLHGELERFRVPSSLAGRLTAHGVIPRRLTPIFRDRHELAAAHDLGAEIREALAASHCLIVLCSPASAASKWTNAEIELFKRIHPDGCVIAAIVGGEPFASEIKGREEEECLPPALRQKYDRRGRPTGKRAEPLAADLRETGDGRRLGFLKIVAGMLGLRLDDLVQREQLRRQRRLAGITGASLGGMVIASILAVTAIQARDEARDQRREAEGLVEFMLGDLKDKLEPIGRLDALDGVGSRVLAYYGKQDTSELSDQGLAQRSQALTLMGKIAQSRGNLDIALALYRQAYTGTAEAVQRDPNDPQRLFEHAQNVFYIGDIARARGDLAAVEAASREYKSLADRMAALEPDNLRWRMERQYAAINLGILLYNQRRYADAAGLFEGTIAPMMSLASMDPDTAEYQDEATTGLAWHAQAQWALGQLDAAAATRGRQVSFLEQLVERGKTDVALRKQLVPARQGLGLIFMFRGQLDRAVEEFRLAAAQGDRLIQIEPDNAQWKGLTAGARLELAKALLANGLSAQAAEEARVGCKLATEVLSKNPGTTSRRLRTVCLEVQSRLALRSGVNADALMLAERALESARAERDVDPINDRYSIAARLRLLGDVHQRMGNADAANRAWSAGLAQLPRNVAERPMEMSERAELLRRLGRLDEARPLAARLEAIGYRSVST